MFSSWSSHRCDILVSGSKLEEQGHSTAAHCIPFLLACFRLQKYFSRNILVVANSHSKINGSLALKIYVNTEGEREEGW